MATAFLDLFVHSLDAVLQLFAMAAAGILCARIGLVNAASRKFLSEMSFKITIPCLLFSNIIKCPYHVEKAGECQSLLSLLHYAWPFFILPFSWDHCWAVCYLLMASLVHMGAPRSTCGRRRDIHRKDTTTNPRNSDGGVYIWQFHRSAHCSAHGVVQHEVWAFRGKRLQLLHAPTSVSIVPLHILDGVPSPLVECWELAPSVGSRTTCFDTSWFSHAHDRQLPFCSRERFLVHN